MGNHTAGNAMGMHAQSLYENRPNGMTAIQILDLVCKPYRGCDAEFAAKHPTKRGHMHPDFSEWCDPHPKAGLGMLMLEAFAPNGVADISKYAPMLTDSDEASELACDLWWDEVRMPFKKRYKFC